MDVPRPSLSQKSSFQSLRKITSIASSIGSSSISSSVGSANTEGAASEDKDKDKGGSKGKEPQSLKHGLHSISRVVFATGHNMADEITDKTKKLLIHDRVHLTVINKTRLPLQATAWPCKIVQDGKKHNYGLSTSRGTEWDGTVPEDGFLSTEEAVQFGSIRRPKGIIHASHWGWTFFDLIKPDGYRVHFQCFIHVGSGGIEDASLGRLDLDSNINDPQQSGKLGRVEYDGKKSDEVRFIIPEDADKLVNSAVDTTRRAILQPGKKIECSTYVSHPKSVLSLIVG